MIALTQKGYTDEQVLKHLYYSDDSRVKFYKYNRLDQYDRVVGEFAKITGGKINNQVFSEIKRQGTFQAHDEPGIDYLRSRIQPVFCLKIGEDILEYPLGVFVISSPKKTSERGTTTRELQCYDKSIIMLRDYFDDVYYIPEGSNYINEVVKIIGTTGIKGVKIPVKESVTSRDLEFDTDMSKMKIVNELLQAVNYNALHFDGNGYAISEEYILPSERVAEILYQTDNCSVVYDGASEELDLFNIPNVFRATSTNPETQTTLTSIYKNTNPASPVSIPRVGWQNVAPTYNVDDIDTQASLDAYVKRNAYLNMDKFNKVVFESANMPFHDHYNCIFMRHDDLSVAGLYLESSWSMDLNPQGRMLHEVRRQIVV